MYLVTDTLTIIAVIANEPEKPLPSSLDVPGVDLGVSTNEIVKIVREGRERG